MDVFQFDKMKLRYGSLFRFMDQRGEVWDGSFISKIGDYSFQFNNFSNGKIQTIEIKNLQFASVIKHLGE